LTSRACPPTITPPSDPSGPTSSSETDPSRTDKGAHAHGVISYILQSLLLQARPVVQDLAAAYVSGLPDDRRQRAEEALYSRLTATMRERDRLQKERNAYRAALVEAARHVGALVELVRDEAKEPE
jgi:hypothetical protein